MSKQEQNEALEVIFQDVNVIQPSDLEVFQMFEDFLKNDEEEIPNLPRGFGQ